MGIVKELYDSLWPNIIAPSFWTLLGILLSHLHHKKHLEKQNDLLDTTTPGGLKEVLDEVRSIKCQISHQGQA